MNRELGLNVNDLPCEAGFILCHADKRENEKRKKRKNAKRDGSSVLGCHIFYMCCKSGAKLNQLAFSTFAVYYRPCRYLRAKPI